jgi:hypothetical protein
MRTREHGNTGRAEDGDTQELGIVGHWTRVKGERGSREHGIVGKWTRGAGYLGTRGHGNTGQEKGKGTWKHVLQEHGLRDHAKPS